MSRQAEKRNAPAQELQGGRAAKRVALARHLAAEVMRGDEEEEEYDEAEPRSASAHTPSRGAKRKTSTRSTGSPASMTSGCRFDSSLGMLTKKFLTLIDDSANGILDLNKAADMLKVQKRRIYDITNVLEGVGLIEKQSKNNIRWKGSSTGADKDTEPEAAQLRQDLATLQAQEKLLDDQFQILTASIRAMAEDPVNQRHLYVTDEDVTSLPCFANDTLFAVKAGEGTTLEVPDPLEKCAEDGQRHYRIFFRSTTGQIDVYLVQHPDSGAGPGGPGSEPGTAHADASCANPLAADVTPSSMAALSQQQALLAPPQQQQQQQQLAGGVVGPHQAAMPQAAVPPQQQQQAQQQQPPGQQPQQPQMLSEGPPSGQLIDHPDLHTAVKAEPSGGHKQSGLIGSPFPFPFPTPLTNGASPVHAALPNYGVFNSPVLNFFASPGGGGAAKTTPDFDTDVWWSGGLGLGDLFGPGEQGSLYDEDQDLH